MLLSSASGPVYQEEEVGLKREMATEAAVSSSKIHTHRVSITLTSRSRSPSSHTSSHTSSFSPASDETRRTHAVTFSPPSPSPASSTTTSLMNVKPTLFVNDQTTIPTSASETSMRLSRRSNHSRDFENADHKTSQVSHPKSSSPTKQPSPQSSVDSAFTSVNSGTSFMSRLRNSSNHSAPEATGSHHHRNKPSSFSSRRSSSGSSSSGSEFELLDEDSGPGEDVRNGTSSPQAIRQCNRYGWFIDSEEAQVE